MDTQKGLRLHIAIFGKTNSGKSTLMNLLTEQATSMVSPKAGTTTDPVYKNMEVDGLGPVTFIDTAGTADETELGDARMARTMKVVDEIDGAIFIDEVEDAIAEPVAKKNIPVLKLDRPFPERDEILKALVDLLKEKKKAPGLFDGMAVQGGHLLFVMPQDASAPKGRLILPQVQALREVLDKGLTATICDLNTMESALAKLAKAPDWIVTDSQVFSEVYEKKPAASKITSFSILFARAKGDMDAMMEGAKTLRHLPGDAKILMAEACTHAPKEEDIGRVKIPAMLRKKLGDGITVDFTRGLSFPENIGDYDLIIMCGSCMFQRPVVQARVAKAKEKNVPVTNYGLVIAEAKGILDKIDL